MVRRRLWLRGAGGRSGATVRAREAASAAMSGIRCRIVPPRSADRAGSCPVWSSAACEKFPAGFLAPANNTAQT